MPFHHKGKLKIMLDNKMLSFQTYYAKTLPLFAKEFGIFLANNICIFNLNLCVLEYFTNL